MVIFFIVLKVILSSKVMQKRDQTVNHVHYSYLQSRVHAH